MKLSIHFGDFEPSRSFQQDVSDLIRNAVERFGSRVRSVNISLRDINGPKGGVDKQCRCVVHLKRMSPIVIDDSDESYRSLVNRVAERVAYRLNQKIDRVQKGRRSRQSRGNENDSEFPMQPVADHPDTVAAPIARVSHAGVYDAYETR
ncbi:hypothetical protein NZK35_25765 [Stieleria sp. ICT_E10.1]|uniref:hypothetical protein n=1 Tax=Stieleria sedimenti TaxID=2976331 RepID=UPI00217FAD1E|nr:hypothetical protein [Stieleria sedimenti]MCS7470066.1 hypothetical protein [Stieleria sedimenti]